MSESNDDIFLNDLDEELEDFDLDPKQEAILLDQDDDVLDLNIDYDQIDVSEDGGGSERGKKDQIHKSHEKKQPPNQKKQDIGKSINERNESKRALYAKRDFKRKHIGNRPYNSMRRSKTVLINPRFKGPVHVEGNQLPYEPPQTYIQPWAPAPVCAPENLIYLQQQQLQQLQQHLNQPMQQLMQSQVFMNQAHMTNQNSVPNQHFMNHQQPPSIVQMNPCTNMYNQAFQQPQQIDVAQQMNQYNSFQPPPPPVQVCEPKLPVHQRLGIPNNNLNQQLNHQVNFQNVQYNQAPTENENFNQFNHIIPEKFHVKNEFVRKAPDSFPYNRNRQRNFGGNSDVNEVPHTTRRSQFLNQKPKVIKEVQPVEVIHHNVKVDTTPDISTTINDEDEETREYRLKIEMQKKKREEILRKKEESRLKNVTQQPTVILKPVRSFQQKKTFRPQLPKPQSYTNNIVITGNDDYRFGHSYQKKKIKNNNFNQNLTVPKIVQTERIVTAGQVTIPNKKPEVKSEDISSFLSTRSVLVQEDLLKTPVVVVKNLASTTNEPKLMKLCRDIGKVQKIQMEKQEHRATIQFNTVASAHAFYKKFRRYMIDLSMIQVDLVPYEGSS